MSYIYTLQNQTQNSTAGTFDNKILNLSLIPPYCQLKISENNESVNVPCANGEKIYKFSIINNNLITEPFHINNSTDLFFVQGTYRPSSSVNNSFSSSSNFTFLARNFHRSIQK